MKSRDGRVVGIYLTFDEVALLRAGLLDDEAEGPLVPLSEVLACSGPQTWTTERASLGRAYGAKGDHRADSGPARP